MTAGSGIHTWGGTPEAPLRRIYVVAGNYREFMFWCKEFDISRNDPRVHYVSDFSKLMGAIIEESKGDKVVLYGTFESRMDWPLVAEELTMRWRP